MTTILMENMGAVAEECIAACDACAKDCNHCFAHMDAELSDNACPACCIECAAVCRLVSDSIARHSPLAQQLSALCAEICDWCEKQFSAHDDEHCRTCAESCRRCAVACRAMAAADPAPPAELPLANAS